VSTRLIVFDLDGTLIDSHAFITRMLAETFEAEGFDAPTEDAGKRIIGLSLPEALTVLSGGEGAHVDRLVARYRELYHASVSGAAESEALYPGARDAVLALAKAPDTLLGIATGKAMRGVNRVLGLHGFEGLFVTLQTPDSNPSKPHPGMLLRAMDETGVEPNGTVMIGDTTFDIDMARAAGVHSVGVSWGAHDVGELIEAGADRMADDFTLLLDAVDELTGFAHA
jgi:phosphoglycolate phosphatase